MSQELNQEPVAVPGDSVQTTPETKEQIQENVAEEIKDNQPEENAYEKVLNDQKFMDAFYAKVGDGVKTIVENRIAKALEEKAVTDSQVADVKPTQVAPESSKVQDVSLEQPKESDSELAALKAKVAELEGNSVDKAIRNMQSIQELAGLNPQEAERFIKRAVMIAKSNNLSELEVSRIFSEGTDIQKDLTNQLFMLKNAQSTEQPNNIPNKQTVVNPHQKVLSRKERIAKNLYG